MGDVDSAIHLHQGDGGARRAAQPLKLAPPAYKLWVLGDAGSEVGQALAAAPVALDIVEQLLQRFLVRDPVLELRERAVQDQTVTALGMVRGEQGGQGAAFGYTHDKRRLEADRVHHRADVIHAFVHAGKGIDLVGHAGAALVEHGHACAAADLAQIAVQSRLVPVVVDMRHESGHEDYVRRAVAKQMVGDVDVAALGITGSRPWNCCGIVQPVAGG